MTTVANYLMAEGLGKVQYQVLDQCFKGFQSRKGYSEVTFTTNASINGLAAVQGGQVFDKCGILFWLDRKVMEKANKLPDAAGVQHNHGADLLLVMQALEAARQSGALAELPADAFVAAETLVEQLQDMFEGGS